MNSDVVGRFSIGEKFFEIKKTETPDTVDLFITVEGKDSPLSGSQLYISKKELLFSNSRIASAK